MKNKIFLQHLPVLGPEIVVVALTVVVMTGLLFPTSVIHAEEKEITVPINVVVKVNKLSAEQLTKEEVTVPTSWVKNSWLEKHGKSDRKAKEGTKKSRPEGTKSSKDTLASSGEEVKLEEQVKNIREDIPTSEDLRVHEGDLVIEAGETLSVKGEQLLVKGSIIAKPDSKVVIEDSTVMVNLNYAEKTPHNSIDLRSSEWKVVNSKIIPVGKVLDKYHEFGRYKSFYYTPL